jgi:hypothetical protein
LCLTVGLGMTRRICSSSSSSGKQQQVMAPSYQSN